VLEEGGLVMVCTRKGVSLLAVLYAPLQEDWILSSDKIGSNFYKIELPNKHVIAERDWTRR
jgi:hypothetical protein